MANKTHIELNNEITKRGSDGFYQLEKDKEAIKAFEADVQARTKQFDSPIERLWWLIDNDFYYNLFEQYDEMFVEDLMAEAKSYDFKFQSYMASSKFYNDYALKTDDKQTFLEDYAEHVVIVSLYLAEGSQQTAERFMQTMMEQRYQPATPTFMNAGRARRGEMVSCFLLSSSDSLNGISFTENVAGQLSKIGGGVAIDLSSIRSRGGSIKGIEGVAKGVLPVAKLLEGKFGYADQLGQRPGAGAVYVHAFHYDALELLGSKKINSDEDLRLSTISIGLTIPDLFFDLAEQDKDIVMFDPHTVKQQYGMDLMEIDLDVYYEDMVANDKLRKRSVSARDYLSNIARTQIESGYPYIVFIDNANRQHALGGIGQIRMSNLCTEIFQLQEEHVINDYGVEDEINRDISCNLGSLNIANVMESKKVGDSVYDGIMALTSVTDGTSIANAPGVKKANEELHAVGLGAMNLHGYLAKNKIMYESTEAKDFVNVFFMMMNFYSLKASSETARDRGETFKDFADSDYASGKYFEKYIKYDILPKTAKVKELFQGIEIPSAKDWEELAERVSEDGLYHAYRLAVAPTQSISYIQNATSALSPVVDLIENRKYGNAETYYPMPFLSPETQWYYKSAFSTSMYKMIDLIAVAQQHVDQGISTILFVDSEIDSKELARYYIYAHQKGLKSLYYTRNKLLSIEECTSCAV